MYCNYVLGLAQAAERYLVHHLVTQSVCLSLAGTKQPLLLPSHPSSFFLLLAKVRSIRLCILTTVW